MNTNIVFNPGMVYGSKRLGDMSVTPVLENLILCHLVCASVPRSLGPLLTLFLQHSHF